MAENDLRLAPIETQPVETPARESEPVASAPVERKSLLEIVRWMLVILAAVYSLAFALAFVALVYAGMTFANTIEFVQFMIGSIVPLAALVVGYYLGDRARG